MPTIVNFRDVILQAQAPRVLSVAPSSFTSSFTPVGIQLNVLKSSNPAVIRYEFRVGATWASSALITQDGGTNYLWTAQPVGTYVVWVAAVDNINNYSVPVSLTVVIAASTMSTFTDIISGRNLQLNWSALAGSFGSLQFEVRSGASGVAWNAATSKGFYNANTYQEVVAWAGNFDYLVAALDVAGNYSAPMRLNITVGAPGAPTAPTVQIVDNNVLIYWNAPTVASNQLTIASYEIRKGATWIGSPVIGSNGNSTFTSVFEQLAGVYTYWIAAIDTSGTYGSPVSIAATVNAPPDFIFRNNFNSSFGGTFVNAYQEQGSYLLPANLAQSFAAHFTANSWTTPDNQIAAGYPIYISPSTTSASYTELIDYGGITPTSTMTTTLGFAAVSGTVSITCTISWKLNAGDAWTVLPVGAVGLIPASFRYVQVVYNFTSTAGANLIRLNSLNLRLSIKLRNDSGSASITAGGGTAVTFAYPFIYADTPVVVANGLDAYGKPYTCAVIYAGVPNPTGFSVRIFNSSGVEMTTGVLFSWTARGY